MPKLFAGYHTELKTLYSQKTRAQIARKSTNYQLFQGFCFFTTSFLRMP